MKLIHCIIVLVLSLAHTTTCQTSLFDELLHIVDHPNPLTILHRQITDSQLEASVQQQTYNHKKIMLTQNVTQPNGIGGINNNNNNYNCQCYDFNNTIYCLSACYNNGVVTHVEPNPTVGQSSDTASEYACTCYNFFGFKFCVGCTTKYVN